MSIISDTKKKFDIISFGEVMLRLSLQTKKRFLRVRFSKRMPVVQNLMWLLVQLS